jgi:1,4-dihydroxy-2-naphthoate octaprenyltransferase
MPVGEFFAGGALGLVLLVLSVYVQSRAIDWPTLALGLPSTLLIAAILAANNACDRVGDAAAGRRTLAIVVGERGAVWVVDGLVAGGFASALGLAAIGVLPRFAALPLVLAAVLSIKLLAGMRARGYAHRSKGANMGGISAIFMAFTASMVLSLLVQLY